MIYGYARVSTGGQSVDAQVRQLTKAGCKKVFREVAHGDKTDRVQLRRVIAALQPGDERAFGVAPERGKVQIDNDLIAVGDGRDILHILTLTTSHRLFQKSRISQQNQTAEHVPHKERAR